MACLVCLEEEEEEKKKTRIYILSRLYKRGGGRVYTRKTMWTTPKQLVQMVIPSGTEFYSAVFNYNCAHAYTHGATVSPVRL